MTESTTAPQALMHSAESERMVLSAALNADRKPMLDNLLGLIAASDFHNELHGLTWNCIRLLHDMQSPCDAVSVIDYARKKGLFIGGVEYVAGLVEDTLGAAASEDAILSAASRIKGYATVRSLRDLLGQVLKRCETGSDTVEQLLELVDDGVQHLRKTSQTSRGGAESIETVLDNVLAVMEKQMDGEIMPATSSGYPELDNVINGFADEDFVVIGARPSMGKTTLLTNLARNIAKFGGPAEQVLIFSLEMKSSALGQRFLASESRVGLSDLMRASIQESDWSRISEGLESMRGVKIWIDDTPGLTIHDIRARARAHMAKHGKCKIGVDYIQYVTARQGIDDMKKHTAEVSRGLKKRLNKRPVMSDLRESGAIEQDADIIMFLYRDEVYNPETQAAGIAEVIVAKHRNGPTGTCRLGFDRATNSFHSLGY
jgi:replicative DNA helicase